MNLRTTFRVVAIWVMVFQGIAVAGDEALSYKKNRFKVALEYEYQDVDMELTSSRNALDIAWWNSTFEVPYERHSMILKCQYSIFNQFDVFAGIGGVKDDLEADPKDSTYSRLTNEGDTNVIWVVGLNYVFYTFESGLYFGARAEYSQWDSGDDSFDDGRTMVNDPRDFETEIRQISASLYSGITLGKFSPFLGIEYTDLEIEQELGNYPLVPGYIDEYEYEIEDNWGAFAGVSYQFTGNIEATVKAKLLNQTSISISMGYAF